MAVLEHGFGRAVGRDDANLIADAETLEHLAASLITSKSERRPHHDADHWLHYASWVTVPYARAPSHALTCGRGGSSPSAVT